MIASFFPIPSLSRVRTTLAWSTLTLLGVSACAGDETQSHTDDIFVEDRGDGANGNERRRPASDSEILWTIYMGGCTGHLISPDLMMTAAHCSPQQGAVYSSGYGLKTGKRNDIRVTAVVESSQQLDYAILRITWPNGFPTEQRFPPLVATKASDVAVNGREDRGDELYTVGFPTDKVQSWGATYAQGYAKAVSGDRLLYNIGIINGNSGGGVWRKRDKMLVSLTNAGPHAFGQPGWNTAPSASASNWNNGAAMWAVYARSKTLQDVFPDGKNRFAPSDENASKDVFMALGEPGDAAGSFVLYISTPKAAARAFWCETDSPAACKPDAPGYTLASAAYDETPAGPLFRGNRATTLRDGLKLSIVIQDSEGKTIGTRVVRFEAQ